MKEITREVPELEMKAVPKLEMKAVPKLEMKAVPEAPVAEISSTLTKSVAR